MEPFYVILLSCFCHVLKLFQLLKPHPNEFFICWVKCSFKVGTLLLHSLFKNQHVFIPARHVSLFGHPPFDPDAWGTLSVLSAHVVNLPLSGSGRQAEARTLCLLSWCTRAALLCPGKWTRKWLNSWGKVVCVTLHSMHDLRPIWHFVGFALHHLFKYCETEQVKNLVHLPLMPKGTLCIWMRRQGTWQNVDFCGAGNETRLSKTHFWFFASCFYKIMFSKNIFTKYLRPHLL